MTKEQTMAGTYVIVTTDHRVYFVTQEQAHTVARAMATGMKIVAEVGGGAGDFVSSAIVGDILRWETYERQMRWKLMERGQKMCKRCGNIVSRADKCGCREDGNQNKPEYEPIVSMARKENAKLDKALTQLAAKMSVPELDNPAR